MLAAPMASATADTHVQDTSFAGRSAEGRVEPTGPPARSAARGLVNCGEVITKNTTLLANVGPCPGDGIIIGADNIRLNLNGYTIFGTEDVGAFAGIRLPGRTGVTVTGHPGGNKTGTVTGFDAGVVIRGGFGNTIENLLVKNNVGPTDPLTAALGDGIYIVESSGNAILNNHVTGNGIFDGIGVDGPNSNQNRIEGNLIENNLHDGITLYEGANETIITGNVIRTNGFSAFTRPLLGAGINIFGNAAENVVENNTVEGNRGSGIQIQASAPGFSPGNQILYNYAVNNGLRVPGQRGGGYDLSDNSGSAVPGTHQSDCGTNVWWGNVYITAYPECTTAGGTQVAG